ncbi:class I SAM-dependent methyltransferase [Aurantiacibacter poecillastricola]|uniref:class I SAM-dependent methyltransferase n=1 Tax=Aurantiacibacter poecillastricola TaxID=3064385 RepID=UPI00273F22D3|nr:class I SAM-dependent methyltransferase [Aurantiacibacter sp. 219JJ12-13]MDP5261640.1 class I SAM-dependent methyltransferase [Aurantiacibacter sp. 219JJ12-13]
MDAARQSYDDYRFARQSQAGFANFWSRFGGPPSFAGKRVLELGSGRGGMIHAIMRAGAASAVGVEIDEDYLAFARPRLAAEWGDRVDMREGDIAQMDFAPVDLVVSCNTLEHVLDLDNTLQATAARCKPGADMYFGFAPLWYSPYGHHGFADSRVPWIHLLRGEDDFVSRFNRDCNTHFRTVREAGFNKYGPAEFERAIRALPVEVLSSRRNVGTTKWRTALSQLFLIPGLIPPLEKYVTVGMYWHLRKTDEV